MALADEMFYLKLSQKVIKTLRPPLMMLKSDLHIHTKEDPLDVIKYSARQLIDYMAKRKYDVIAITPHKHPVGINGIKDYARSKGILLIEGSERRVEGKDVLVYDYDKPVKTFADLERAKDENALIIAPHPFYGTNRCLGKKLERNIKLFDAVEYSHFYTDWMNHPNKEAKRLARRYNKPMIGTSDAHKFFQLGHTFSFLDAEKDKDSVFEAVRKNKIGISTKPLPNHVFFRIALSAVFSLKKKPQAL
jgi:predicted metal-dependent phosphoesterase TrpH